MGFPFNDKFDRSISFISFYFYGVSLTNSHLVVAFVRTMIRREMAGLLSYFSCFMLGIEKYQYFHSFIVFTLKTWWPIGAADFGLN